MAPSCTEVTYIGGLVLALTCAFGGFVTPYWQIDKIPQETGYSVEIQVGLNYACVESDPHNMNRTMCRAMPLFHHDAAIVGNVVKISVVRWLITFHVILMAVSVAFSGVSHSCHQCEDHGKQQMKTAAVTTAVMSVVLGISGLAVFAGDGARYSSPFDAEFPVPLSDLEQEEKKLVDSDHLSFLLSGLGCVVFAAVGCVKAVVKTRRKRKNGETIYAGGDAKVISVRNAFNYAPEDNRRYLVRDATAAAEGSIINSDPPWQWNQVETCHVEIFRTHRSRRHH